MYGQPSGPYYGPGGRWAEHPKERPGTRVKVIPNDDLIMRDWVGRVGTAIRRDGPGYLVYFDHSIDLNVPSSCLERLPVLEDNAPEDHLFTMRNRIT
jgi:hypothetical protein